MGLDGVELIIAYEEHFGVSISDSEAEKLLTPRMVCDLILTKLTLTDSKKCQSQRAFYLLRRGIVSLFKLNRNSITPATPLADFVSKNDTIRTWALLREFVQARVWPELRRPTWLVVFLTLLSLTPFILLNSYTFYLPAATALVLAFVGVHLTKCLKNALPKKITTVRDLIPYTITSDEIPWTREKVSECVKIITIETLALADSEYFEDAHFINDLGVD